MKVLIVVTHLLGAGHLSRALTLARAFVAEGHNVTLSSGGLPVPQFNSSGVDLRQLPPLCSDGANFTTLLTAKGRPASADYLAGRQDILCALAKNVAPDIVITELFPFGRRILRAEFLALLEVVSVQRLRPVILASVRDILAPPSKPERAVAADEVVARFYDGVLVHSDPALTRLEESWPVSAALAAKLIYTGYVAPAPAGPHRTGAGTDEVLVSAGGGAVGTALFRIAVAAAQLAANQRWRILVGGADPTERVRQLTELAGSASLTVEPARPDFRQMLHHAACSVSMCGYNTALDLLQAGTPAVFVPFDEGGEVEQTIRARSLSANPGIRTMNAEGLTPQALAKAVAEVMAAKPAQALHLKFDGALQTVRLATRMAKARS
ncbi:MAG: glycosyltransferase family protein [Cypionkella sp.]